MQNLLKKLPLVTYAVVVACYPAAADRLQRIDNNRFILGVDQQSREASGISIRAGTEDAAAFDLDTDGDVLPAIGLEEQNKIRNVRTHISTDKKTSNGPAEQSFRENNIRYALPCLNSPISAERTIEIVRQSALAHGVDPGFATAVAWAESRFDRVRNSSRGARGPMQLMPGTAKDLGVTDICDPASNVDGGVRYLRELLDEFGNPLLAAAAYNAGAQAVRDHNGVPPYTETINYLAEILNFQLGLRTPWPQTASHKKPEQPSTDSGVIGGTSAARFVGGVLRF